MPTVIEHLEQEWARLTVEQRAVARLSEASAAAGSARDLASLEAYVHTSGRPVDVVVGRAGSGKTYALAAAASIWA